MKLSPATRATLKRLTTRTRTRKTPRARRSITERNVTAFMSWWMDQPRGT